MLNRREMLKKIFTASIIPFIPTGALASTMLGSEKLFAPKRLGKATLYLMGEKISLPARWPERNLFDALCETGIPLHFINQEWEKGDDGVVPTGMLLTGVKDIFEDLEFIRNGCLPEGGIKDAIVKNGDEFVLLTQDGLKKHLGIQYRKH